MMTIPYKRSLLLALFGSGFSALIFEVLWTKLLSLTFGSTIWAVGMVVATFMVGLALGGYLFGRVADRVRNPLRLYAALELGIALSAILFRPALQLVEDGYVALSGQFSSVPVLSTLFLLSFSSILLLPPTLCMGGTLPVIGTLLKRGRLSRDIGWLYAVNVAGAAVGAFLAGYWLIPFWGISRTEAFAYAINLAIAAGFWWQGRYPREQDDNADVADAAIAGQSRRILLCTFLVGAAALALQLLWTRVLVLFLGSSTYAFSSILSVCLLCMAVGGACFIPLQKRFSNLPHLFAGLAIVSGLYVLATAPFYDQLPYLLLEVYHWSSQSWWLYTLLVLPIVMLVVGPPAFCSGALFPAALAIFSPDAEKTGRRVGRVVLSNTMGAVVGSLAGAFWMIPHTGLLAGLKLASVVSLLSGVVVARCQLRQAPVKTLICYGSSACLAIFLALYPFRWDVKLMNNGIYYYAAKYASRDEFQARMNKQRLLASYEGTDATVTVRDNLASGNRYFTVNGKIDGGSADMATQILLGQLPVLLHPNPQEILVIGLGTGVTLGTVTQFPARRIDCVEISPEVVLASDFFRDINLNPRADARVTTHLQDARNYLLLHRGKYDVITSEPSNPWQVGNANLFTSEFFTLVRGHLRPGGVFCQWVPLYDLTSDNLKVLLRTFSEVFPNAHLFMDDADLFMIGSTDETKIHYQGIKSRLASYFSSTKLSVVASPAELLARHYLFSDGMIEEFVRGARLNTDLFPILEYSSRYSLADQSLRDARGNQNIQDLQAVVERKRQVLPIVSLGSSPEEVERSTQEILASFAGEKRGAVTVRGR